MYAAGRVWLTEDVEYDEAAFRTYRLVWALLNGLSYFPALAAALHQLYGWPNAKQAFYCVCVPGSIMIGICVYYRTTTESMAMFLAMDMAGYLLALVGFPLMGFIVGRAAGEKRLGRSCFIFVVSAAITIQLYANVFARAYFRSDNATTPLLIRVGFHSLWKFALSHVGASLALVLQQSRPASAAPHPGGLHIDDDRLRPRHADEQRQPVPHGRHGVLARLRRAQRCSWHARRPHLH